MSQKNEILPLLLTVLVTSAVLGVVAWWLVNIVISDKSDTL
jgi:phosphate transport system substrate-binding protein